MTECYLHHHDENAPCRCFDCGHECRAGDLAMIHDIQERIAPGEIVPAGECPQCGALSYLDLYPEPAEPPPEGLGAGCDPLYGQRMDSADMGKN